MKKPPVSVIMPVYNADKYLKLSIKSILAQSFGDFEFIIVDNASTDHSIDIIRSFSDERIKLLCNTENKGNYYSRNKGMKIASGKYIAVMDADDVSLPLRLEHQYHYLERHPAVGITGSWFQRINGDNCSMPEEHDLLKILFLFGNYMGHPTLFMRKTVIDQYNLYYDTAYRYAADYELLTRAFSHTRIQPVQEFLLYYRCHETQDSSVYYPAMQAEANNIRLNYLVNNLKLTPTEKQIKLHLALINPYPEAIPFSTTDCESWVQTVTTANESIGYFDQGLLHRTLSYSLQKQMPAYE